MHQFDIKPSKYLVCVDNTDVSRVALRFAAIKGAKRGILIDMLHVIVPAEMQPIGSVAEKMRQEQRAETEAMMNSLAQEAHDIAGITPSIWIREGKPSEEILELAMSDPDINMIVLGVNPESKSGDRVISWLTSAAEKLMVPIMLVPATLTDAQMEKLG
jgi:nucleotide-binding universal stress UspA family protein